MDWREVYSSTVDRIAYDPASRSLHVLWRRSGKTSVYQDVPPDVAFQTMNAHSIGKAINEIKGDYQHAYLEDGDGKEEEDSA